VHVALSAILRRAWFFYDWVEHCASMSPVSEKSSMVVSSVMLASLSSPFAAMTPAAQLRIVPPTDAEPERMEFVSTCDFANHLDAFNGPRLK